MSHVPVCVKCEIGLRPSHNGFKVIDSMSEGTQFFKIWDADKWKCPGCDYEVVIGFGRDGVEHFQDSFGKYLKNSLTQQQFCICYEKLSEQKKLLDEIERIQDDDEVS